MFDSHFWEERYEKLWNLFDSLEERIIDNFPAFSTLTADITNHGDYFLLQENLAGFTKQEISIDLTDDFIIIQAEHKGTTEKEHRFFSRKISASNIKTEQIKASYENGLLKVILPKQEEKPKLTKKISIE